MTRGDIGTIPASPSKTISRSAGCFQKRHAGGEGKYITIENSDLLAQLAGQARNVA